MLCYGGPYDRRQVSLPQGQHELRVAVRQVVTVWSRLPGQEPIHYDTESYYERRCVREIARPDDGWGGDVTAIFMEIRFLCHEAADANQFAQELAAAAGLHKVRWF